MTAPIPLSAPDGTVYATKQGRRTPERRTTAQRERIRAQQREYDRGFPERGVLNSAIQRCHNPRRHDYARYGGRGILVCDEWRSDGGLRRFLAHIGPRPSPAHSLDRIDSNGHYEPGNVRWATRKEQNDNRRSARLLELDGETRSLTDWARSAGIERKTLCARLGRGWDLRRALIPGDMRRAKAALCGVSPETVRGWR